MLGTVFMQHYYFVFETHFTKTTKMTIGERVSLADIKLFPRQGDGPDYFLEAMLIICLAVIGSGFYIFFWVKKRQQEDLRTFTTTHRDSESSTNSEPRA